MGQNQIENYFSYDKKISAKELIFKVSKFLFVSLLLPTIFFFILGLKNFLDDSNTLSYFDGVKALASTTYFAYCSFQIFIIQLVITIVTSYPKTLDEVFNKKQEYDADLKKEKKEIKDIITKQIDEKLKDAKIVFQTGIHEYDDKYLDTLQKILNGLSDDVKNIYVIDNSDPLQWWSDSMTGYLGLLSDWKSKVLGRNIHRIFILSEHELQNPVSMKTLNFHCLIGFNTYVFEEKVFYKLFDNFRKRLNIIEEPYFKSKELLVWSKPTENTVSISNEAFKGDVLMYQSFWDIIKHNKAARENLCKTDDFKWSDWKNDIIKSKDIKVFFEFIPYIKGDKHDKNIKRESIAKNQTEFIKELRKNTYCCSKYWDLNDVEQKDFGIEIKTINCNSCGLFKKEKEKMDKCKSFENNINTFEYVKTDEIRQLFNVYLEKIKI